MGLRTLVLCQKEISVVEYEKWAKKYQVSCIFNILYLFLKKNQEACTSIIDRDKKMTEVQEEIEQNLDLIGATAIEDKLQDDVGIIKKR